MGNGGKVKLDPKKKLYNTYRTFYYPNNVLPGMQKNCKQDGWVISDLVAKISSNSTAGHTREDMVNRVLRRFVAGPLSPVKFNSDRFAIYCSLATRHNDSKYRQEFGTIRT